MYMYMYMYMYVYIYVYIYLSSTSYSGRGVVCHVPTEPTDTKRPCRSPIHPLTPAFCPYVVILVRVQKKDMDLKMMHRGHN